VALPPDAIVRLNLGQLSLSYLDNLLIPVYGFLIKHPDGAGLVDTGYGTPIELIKDYRPVNASVAKELHKHDVDPSDIRWVINSHLHFDHCGQNAVFPQAPVYLQRTEYENRGAYQTPKAWLEYAGARFELLDGETEIVPGVRSVRTPGHTVGHQSIEIDTTDGLALIAGDACWTVEMFEGKPPRGPMMDDMPTALKSLERLRELAPTAVHFCHDKRTWSHWPPP
jgi:N-acyl homoserine lactone hydrolase